MTARVDHGIWLADGVLLLLVAAETAELDVRVARSPDGFTSAAFPYERAGAPELAVVVFLDRRRAGSAGPLSLALGSLSLSVTPHDLTAFSSEARVAGRALGGLDEETRAALLDFLVKTLGPAAAGERGGQLRRSLFALREALRERLPGAVLSRDEARVIAIESVLAVADDAYYIKGWLHDEDGLPGRLTAVSPEGARVELADAIFRHRRADIEHFYESGADLGRRHGFLAYFELDTPSLLPSGWVVELRGRSGEGVEARAEEVVREPVRVRDTILGDLDLDPRTNELLDRHVSPALMRLQERVWAGGEVATVATHGTPPETPDVSIVVPLYRRIDLLEHQLAQFAGDPDIQGADLIYVLDSPELADALGDFARELHELYRVPFRVAVLARNAGYSAANNAGVDLARGRLLLLLNSDVIPERPGWLDRMVSFYDGTDGIGALGPKLLFEDDSLQHAGVYFRRVPGAAAWENDHYFKGLHRSLPAANRTRPVAAVTGACLMIDRALYDRIGRLRGLYVQGDNEDSDLCLRLLESGYRNWYLPEVELYHLEGQSYPSELRRLTRRYNDWLQTRTWGEYLDEVTAAASEAAAEVGVHP